MKIAFITIATLFVFNTAQASSTAKAVGNYFYNCLSFEGKFTYNIFKIDTPLKDKDLYQEAKMLTRVNIYAKEDVEYFETEIAETQTKTCTEMRKGLVKDAVVQSTYGCVDKQCAYSLIMIKTKNGHYLMYSFNFATNK